MVKMIINNLFWRFWNSTTKGKMFFCNLKENSFCGILKMYSQCSEKSSQYSSDDFLLSSFFISLTFFFFIWPCNNLKGGGPGRRPLAYNLFYPQIISYQKNKFWRIFLVFVCFKGQSSNCRFLHKNSALHVYYSVTHKWTFKILNLV